MVMLMIGINESSIQKLNENDQVKVHFQFLFVEFFSRPYKSTDFSKALLVETSSIRILNFSGENTQLCTGKFGENTQFCK